MASRLLRYERITFGYTVALADLNLQGMPWIINSIGAGLVGFALGGCGDIALTYVQDSYDGVRYLSNCQF